MANENDPSEQDDATISWDDAFEEVAKTQSQDQAQPPIAEQPDIAQPGAEQPEPQAATLQPLQPASPPDGAAGAVDLDFILDIPLQVTVEIGRTKLQINDLLQLGQGSVIELTKLVGEPLDVLVNQKVVARGEIVVVNDRFGVRLTDIVSPMERVQQLN